MSGWRVFNLALGRNHFILASAGLTYHGEVWQGSMTGEVFWGLKALQYGAHAQAKILRAWKISTPMRLSALANTGPNRHFIRMERARGGAVVLRFQEIVSADLVAALKAAFQPARPRTTANQEESHEGTEERLGSAPQEGKGRGEGGLLGQGDEEGDVQRLRQDAPREGQQGRRKVTKRKTTKKKPTRRKP